jgi:hypothetical protein
VQKPYEGGSSVPLRRRPRERSRQHRQPRTSTSDGRSILWGAVRLTRPRSSRKKRVRGDRAKSRSRLSPNTLEGMKPKGVSRNEGAKHTRRRAERSPGSKPGNRALPGRPEASAEGTTAGKTVRGSFQTGTPGNLARAMTPKGESHERCRCETEPARDRRAKIVKRVTKP